MAESSEKKLIAFLLCLFFGCPGIHRFYVGKIGTGVVRLLRLGLFGFRALLDLIPVLVGAFKDNEGRPLTDWT